MRRTLWCLITGEPLQWRRGEISPGGEVPEVLQLLHQGEDDAFLEDTEIALHHARTELATGDPRYAGLEALEQRMEPSSV